MNNRLRTGLLSIAVAGLMYGQELVAQQIHTGVPLINSRDSYYESFGTDWGFSRSGPKGYMFFNRGGANAGVPAVGGFDPNAVARFGFGTRGNGGSSYFNAWAGQGSSRSITSATPSLTLQNGYPGYFHSGSVRPFVTGFVPVVEDRSIAPLRLDVVEERMNRLRQGSSSPSTNSQPASTDLILGGPSQLVPDGQNSSAESARSNRSSAERGDISLAEIRQRQANEPATSVEDEINDLIERARYAETIGSKGAARVKYRQAANKATGDLKRALQAKYESLAD